MKHSIRVPVRSLQPDDSTVTGALPTGLLRPSAVCAGYSPRDSQDGACWGDWAADSRKGGAEAGDALRRVRLIGLTGPGAAPLHATAATFLRSDLQARPAAVASTVTSANISADRPAGARAPRRLGRIAPSHLGASTCQLPLAVGCAGQGRPRRRLADTRRALALPRRRHRRRPAIPGRRTPARGAGGPAQRTR